MESRAVPFPMLTVDKGITRFSLQLGSVDQAHRWLTNWNFAHLERRALCLPVWTTPSLQVTSSLANSSNRSGSLPYRWLPSDPWDSFTDFRGVRWVKQPPDVQETSVGSQPPPCSLDFIEFPGDGWLICSIQSSTSLTVVSVEDSGLAMLDPMLDAQRTDS